MTPGGEGAGSLPVPTPGRGSTVTEQCHSAASPSGPNHPAATGALSATTYADALCEIARLVEAGAPRPKLIAVDSFEKVVVHLDHDDLLAWVIHLDLPGLEWDTVAITEERICIARWPDTIVDGYLFRLSCSYADPEAGQ